MNKRVKYNYEFRLRCVEEVLNGNHSVKKVARENGFSDTRLALWINVFKKYGKEGLRPRVSNRHYDPAFKLSVLKAMDKEGLSLWDACVRFNISNAPIVDRWRKAYELKGELGLIPKAKGRPKKMKPHVKRKIKKSSKPLTREEELLMQIESLKAENELLKKLQALAQTKKKQKP